MDTQAILIKDLMPSKVSALEFKPVNKTAENKTATTADESERCSNGVCRVTWKPTRIVAA